MIPHLTPNPVASSRRLSTPAFLPPIVLLISAIFLAQPSSAETSANASVTLAEYRAKLQSLDRLVADCRRAPGPAHCQSGSVGPDLDVAVPGATRTVRFAWLRSVLAEAGKDKSKEPATKPAPAAAPKSAPAGDDNDEDEKPDATPQQPEAKAPTLEEQLEAAQGRLADDLQQVDRLAGHPTPGSDARQRQALQTILAAREYQTAVRQPSLWDRIKEKLFNWISRFFAALGDVGSKSKWIGYAAEIGFVILVCVVLVWLLIRIEHQSRLGLKLMRPAPGAGSASARDWQLWLEDAAKAAAQGAWRDAIHLLYWASISRLESSGLWPADRARTPREYLALLGPESAQRPDLAAISRSFELFWYGGRPAGEADFLRAEELAANLGARSRNRPAARPVNSSESRSAAG